MAAPAGYELFARFAFPPNELGYCGPADTAPDELASHAHEFDGARPYLQAIAEAAARDDPLDVDVVRNYWIGGPLLDKVDPAHLLEHLRAAFTGQVTGLLDDIGDHSISLAHHSFHVFVVYPWVRFLERGPATPVQVMQDCRIRWGVVESRDGDHATVLSQPLTFQNGMLALGEPRSERVRWRKDGTSLAPPPSVGATVAAHWDWLCATLSDEESAALASATQRTLDLVNTTRDAGHH